jgi:hypothetical protein
MLPEHNDNMPTNGYLLFAKVTQIIISTTV